jgi:hypothetical protein
LHERRLEFRERNALLRLTTKTEAIVSKTGLTHHASPEELDELMQVTSPRGWIALIGCALLLVVALAWSLVGTVTDTVDGQGVLLRENGLQSVLAPCDGVITSIVAQAGVPVEEGAPLLFITPPGGKPQPIPSPFSCQILHRIARENLSVKKGASLLLLENLKKPLLARLYVPVNVGYAVDTKMSVQISPANVNSSEFGFLQGHVVSAARFPITQQELVDRLQNQDLAQQLAAGGAKLQIIVELVGDAKTASGYQWSASTGPPLQLYSGTPCQGRIIVAEHRPINLVFPSLGK